MLNNLDYTKVCHCLLFTHALLFGKGALLFSELGFKWKSRQIVNLSAF